jgi:hypothetical protein
VKRDMDLIRALLLYFESRPFLKTETVVPMDGCTEEVVRYHLLLLAQAGLVDFEPELTSTGRIIRAHVLGLNWAGHEFLDAVRSEGVWRKLLAYAKDKGGSLPFDLLKTLATELLKESIK